MSPPSGDPVVEGLTDRMRNLLRALDRQDRLETAQAFVGWLETERGAGRLAGHARELLLRALRVASDPVNFGILELLGPLEPTPLSEIMERTGLGRVAASERVNDMAQTGLAVREMIDDQIRGTALAAGLVEWVGAASSAVGKRLETELAGTGGSG